MILRACPRPASRALAGAALALALAGCAGGGVSGPARPGKPVAQRPGGIVVVPEKMVPQGLAGVLGQDASTLLRRFGTPRLDVTEGDARKLQFTGRDCVLDIYLYPLRPGAAPVAAHVEARQKQGGAAVDRGACIREVEKR
jgi:hypothetical protein